MQTTSPARQRWLHRKCAQHALDYVSAHLSEEFELRDIADVVGFSRVYFHRLFKRVAGENLFECVRRLRLEAAATRLMTERDKNIVDIALETGFSSQPVFARMFHAHFGMSASAWRDGKFWWYNGRFWDWRHDAERRRLKASGKGRIAGAWREYYLDHAMADAADGKRPDCLSTIELKRLPDSHAACLRLYDAESSAEKCLVWRRVAPWFARHGLLTPDAVAVVRLRGNPTIVAPKHMSYDVGVLGADPAGLVELDRQDIPGGLYLIADANGGNPGLSYLYQHWIPTHGLKIDATRPFHTRTRLADSEHQVAQAYIPVNVTGVAGTAR